jgi:hypothetical protein
VVPNFFHLRMIEATVFLGTFSAADIFWYPSPDLCLDQSCLWALRTSWLVFFLSLTCTVNCGTHICTHTHRGVMHPKNGLPSWRNISRMLNGNRMHQSSILSLLAKGLNTYVN